MAVWDDPKELDTDDEAVIGLYDGIKRILENQQKKPKPKPDQKQGPKTPRETTHILRCGKILRVEIQRKVVIISVMKTDGELHQLRIEANQD